MTDEDKKPETSTTVKVLQGTVTTMKITDRASLGMGAVERVLPGVTKVAATTLTESIPVLGPIAGKTVSFLGRWGGRVAVPLQLVIGGGEAIYHGVKGEYHAMGEDIGGTVGGIGGGIAAGAAIGALCTGPLAPVGAVVGGAIGGVIGYFGGAKAGGAIAQHYIDKAAEKKAAAEAEAHRNATFGNALADPMAAFNAKAAKPVQVAAAAIPAAVMAVESHSALPEPSATPASVVSARLTPPAPAAAPAQDPPAPAAAPPAARDQNSLGVLLDNAGSMHGSELNGVFQRVTQFASDNKLSLGGSFSMASTLASALNMVNIGGWANGMIEWAQHFALDAMKGDLINQGPNLAGSTDTRSHQLAAAGTPQLALAPGGAG